jgi:hypothetical protein
MKGGGVGVRLDGRTTRHACYAVSQRKRIEECFGWMKTIGLPRKLRVPWFKVRIRPKLGWV